MTNSIFTQAQWLLAKHEIDRLRQSLKGASDARLVRQVIKEGCIKAGAAGAGSTATSLLPGVGRMLKWAIGLGADAAMTASIQRQMILQIFAIYGREPNSADHQQISKWLGTVGVAGIEVVEHVGGGVVRSLAKRLFSKVFKRGLPLAEVLASTATHVAGTYVVARKADHYCRTGTDLQTSKALAELDPRRVRNWMMMSMATSVDDQDPKSVRDALTQIGDD